MEEIFIWYFEQKGVDNPERFLGVNSLIDSAPFVRESWNEALNSQGQIPENNMNPENPINQIIKLMSQTKKNFDISDVISKLRNKKSRKDK